MEHEELFIYNSLQYKEIEEHAYFMGEKLKRRVSELECAQDWFKYHAQRFRGQYEANREQILECVSVHGLEKILSSPKLLHELLKDDF